MGGSVLQLSLSENDIYIPLGMHDIQPHPFPDDFGTSHATLVYLQRPIHEQNRNEQPELDHRHVPMSVFGQEDKLVTTGRNYLPAFAH